MIKKTYTVRFVTPAFLGNAEQSGQWRTPPFKALMRQWWRVAAAADFGYDYKKMREAEGLLFGHAWLENDKDRKGNKVSARKSAVRLRLDKWGQGRMKKWDSDPQVRHPEVGNNGRDIGSHLYLGYGPLTYRNGTALKANAAIQAGETATLSIAVPDKHAEEISNAIALINVYGALGGRSRNGWGSTDLLPLPEGEGRGEGDEHMPIPDDVYRPWNDALKLDWPHAIGSDGNGPLIWKTQAFDDWKALMRELAQIKIGLRTRFAFHSGNNASRPEERHWLSYPVTNHHVRTWEKKNELNHRLPNSLRFKARPDKDNPKKLRGIIFHMPCLPPKEFNPRIEQIAHVWQQAHSFLDDQNTLARKPA